MDWEAKAAGGTLDHFEGLVGCWHGLRLALMGDKSISPKKVHDKHFLTSYVTYLILRCRIVLGKQITLIEHYMEMEICSRELQTMQYTLQNPPEHIKWDPKQYAAELGLLKKRSTLLPGKSLSQELTLVVKELESEIEKNKRGEKSCVALALEELDFEKGKLNDVEFSRSLCLMFRDPVSTLEDVNPSDNDAPGAARDLVEGLLNSFMHIKDLDSDCSDPDDRVTCAKAVALGKYVLLTFAWKRAFKPKGTEKEKKNKDSKDGRESKYRHRGKNALAAECKKITKEREAWKKALIAVGLAQSQIRDDEQLSSN